ncbi:hypothetical protein MHU86_14144 [Fragilaria crotonensis]|nr:hypothetical protein MHU86_14144 [Fragilaria crotonensis]
MKEESETLVSTENLPEELASVENDSVDDVGDDNPIELGLEGIVLEHKGSGDEANEAVVVENEQVPGVHLEPNYSICAEDTTDSNQNSMSQVQESHKTLADDLEDEEDFEVVQTDDAPTVEQLSAYDVEIERVGGEVIFPQTLTSVTTPWTNLQWLSYKRSVRFCELCTRLTVGQKKWFTGSSTESFETRKLAIYDEPNVTLILRPPIDAKEVQSILDIGDEPVNPRHYLIAETIVDPMTCKLRLSPLTTPTSIESTAAGDNVSPHRLTCFELVTPSEIVLLSALRPKEDGAIMRNSVGFLETKTMEIAIGNALFAAHCPVDHTSLQIFPGNTSSYWMDESGRTALHYACARRSSAAVAALVAAGASASIPLSSEEGELLPIHVSARLLDHLSLSTILAAPRRPDPNALDSHGRTAMYVAATEGTSDDPTALSKCLSALEAWGGNMGSLRTSLSVLVSHWKHDALGPILANQEYRYPLPVPGISVGAYHLYPTHTALVALRRRIQTIGALKADHGFGGGDKLKSQLRGTLQVLLEHGFEPNERLDRVAISFEGRADLMEHVGFTPLQILAAAALDAEQLSKSGVKISTSVLSSVASTLAGAADVLVQFGARINMEPPPLERLARHPPRIPADDSASSLPDVDRHRVKIDGNKDLMDLLGGKERLEACRKIWLEDKVVVGVGKAPLNHDTVLTESDAPGGSNDKSCAICWGVFGSILNRKHKCRFSVRYVCDDCSTKRIKLDNQDQRTSDGQYSLARTDVVRLKADKFKEQQEMLQRRKEQMEHTRLQRLEKEKADQLQRDSLFGGIMEKATSLLSGDDDIDAVGGLHASLGQTRDALNERGDRLNTLSEKTEKLMNASEDFAKMAKELEKSQSGGLFW